MAQALVMDLCDVDVAALQHIQRTATDAREVRRATIVLMSHQGFAARDIAEAVGVHCDTITNTRKRWRAEGLAGLAEKPRSGRMPEADAAYRRLLAETVERSPLSLGYAFTNWSRGRLGAHLADITGVQLSPSWVGELLRREGFRWRRPKHTLKGKRDEDAWRIARDGVRALKKGRAA